MFLTNTTFASAFEGLATQLSGYTTNRLPDDGPNVQRLTDADGRTIGGRIRLSGNIVQLWVTAPSKNRTPHAGPGLRPGRSYHTLLDVGGLDGDPAAVIHAAVAGNLLPVFDRKPRFIGDRPWETSTAVSAPEPEPEPEATVVEPEPEPGPNALAEVPAGNTNEPPSLSDATPEPSRPARKRIAKKATTTSSAKTPRARSTAKKAAAPATDAKPTRKAAVKKTTATKTTTPAKPRSRKTAAETA
ncbi:hypothetical protein ACWEO1_01505 [Kitasatospora cineracea]